MKAICSCHAFLCVNTTLHHLSLVSYIPYCNSVCSLMEVERTVGHLPHVDLISVTWLVYKTVCSVAIAQFSF